MQNHFLSWMGVHFRSYLVGHGALWTEKSGLLPEHGCGFLFQCVYSGVFTKYIISDPGFVSWLQSDLDEGRGRLQLRLRFVQELDGDGEEDWVAIEPGGGSLGNQSAPQLIIVYRP